MTTQPNHVKLSQKSKAILYDLVSRNEELKMTIRFYARVSSEDQNLARQIESFKQAYPNFDTMVKATYEEKISGKDMNRPKLKQMLKDLEENDLVVIKSIDRLSRSTKDLLFLVDEIYNKKANIRIIDNAIDTSTPNGECIMIMFAAMSQMERKNIEIRRNEGIAIAKEQGKYTGRKSGAIALNKDEISRFTTMYKSTISISAIAREFKTYPKTINRWATELNKRGILKDKDMRHNNKYNKKDK